MLHLFGVIAGVLALLAAIPYIRDTIKGETRPNRVTWLIWVILQTIALFAQISGGGRDSLLLTIGDLIASATILLLAFVKGESKWHWIDRMALIGAGIGLILWYALNQPIVALAVTIFIDLCGAVPTLRKSFVDPDSETRSTWWIVGIGAIFGVLAVGKVDVTLLVYPIYLAVINLAVAAAIELGKLNLKRQFK
jgi:hypothetical protein